MESFKFLHFDPCEFSHGCSTAEELLEVKNGSYGAGHIQFLGIDNLFHSSGFGDCVKLENKSCYKK